jgi:hypothetical protein
MLLLYFGLAVFYQFEGRVPEFGEEFRVQFKYFAQSRRAEYCTACPNYNDEISLLISQYLISA